jgi:hypothetical protein
LGSASQDSFKLSVQTFLQAVNGEQNNSFVAVKTAMTISRFDNLSKELDHFQLSGYGTL